MIKLSPRRNQRSNGGGFKVKHALQICVLGGACVWLIYQFQDKKFPLSYHHHHHQEEETGVRRSRATPAAGNENDFSVIKLGRKDLDPRGIEQMTAEDLKNGGQDAEEDKSFDDETKILEEIKVDDDLNHGNEDDPEILDKKLVSGSGSGSSSSSTQGEMGQENKKKKKITKKAAALGGKGGNVTVGTVIESKADRNSTQTEILELQKQELEKASSNSSSGGKKQKPVLNEQRSDTSESSKEETSSSSSGGVESAGSGEKINPSNDNDDTTDPSGENRAGEVSASQNESGSSSSSVLQEETDARTDLETMPQTQTSGNALQATE